MGRIFQDCYVAAKEVGRELQVCGQTVTVGHYQNIPLEGDQRQTKELLGVEFTIVEPWSRQREALELIYGEDAPRIAAYIDAEEADRLSGSPLNPGTSWKVRQDLWQRLMSKDPAKGEAFDYTYAERLWGMEPQLGRCADAIAEDPGTRRAMCMVFWPGDAAHIAGAETRVPCSVDYQFLLRGDRLHTFYHMRSNDFYKHFLIDLVLAYRTGFALGRMVLERLHGLEAYGIPEGGVLRGPVHYHCGSLHAYRDDLDRSVEF